VSDCYIYQVLSVSGYTTFFRDITKYNVFSIALLSVSVLSLLALLVKGGSRLKFSELEAAMSDDPKRKKGEEDELLELD
jgi:hypothetical protein